MKTEFLKLQDNDPDLFSNKFQKIRKKVLPQLKGGTLSGGQEIRPGVLHGGTEIRPGTLHGGQEIRPGTLHNGIEINPGVFYATNYGPATYRTKDGKALYKFRFVNIDGKFEIDILNQPSYGSRDASNVVSHRLPSARGGNKICISDGKEPKTIESARKICMEWSELTHTYIRTGTSIDKQVSDNAKPKPNTKKGFWDFLLN